jgi:DNA-binding CsgD family transcriptional regulator
VTRTRWHSPDLDPRWENDHAPSERQLEVLAAWRKHRTYRGAAGELDIAEQTVKNAMAEMRQKFNTNNPGLITRFWRVLAMQVADPTLTYRRLKYEVDNDYRERQRRTAREGMRRIRAALAGKREEIYAELFAKQNGKCAICHQPETAFASKSGKVRRLAIDHDNRTGSVRELLCRSCNIMLGTADDDPARLQDGIDYLRKHAQAKSHNISREAA